MEANRLRHQPPPPSAPASLPPISLSASINSSHRTFCRPFSTSASDSVRCRCRPDVRRPSWDAAGTERSKFYPYNDLYDDEDDEGDDGGLFGFKGNEKRRKWWSDDVDDEDDEDDEFWGFKILKAFGWMVPAILISMILGTGPNAFFMAVALPLGQTALSLAVNKVWGMARQTSKPRPRNRTRSKPSASASDRNRASNREQDAAFTSSKKTRSSPSSTGSYQPAHGNGHCTSSNFGGWDELDREAEMKPKRNMEEGELKRQGRNSKVSKRVRNRDSPLFIRLLIAVFPFLGSWAKFL